MFFLMSDTRDFFSGTGRERGCSFFSFSSRPGKRSEICGRSRSVTSRSSLPKTSGHSARTASTYGSTSLCSVSTIRHDRKVALMSHEYGIDETAASGSRLLAADAADAPGSA